MKAAIVLCFIVAAVSALVPILEEDSLTAMPNHYIVRFKAGASEHDVTKFLARFHIDESFRYHHTFKGFAAVLDEEVVDLMRLEESHMLENIERETVQYIVQECKTQSNPPSWGLNRISSKVSSFPNRYEYESDGSGVRAYVLDTGIRTTHNDFGGRAIFGRDFVNEGEGDGNGHGSHCAGTVGGTTFGVAKGVTLYAGKVCTRFGSCPTSGTNAAYDYMLNEKRSNPSIPMVVNMSYGGTGGNAACTAIAAASSAGVVFVAAAGNSNADVRSFYPANCPTVIAVGSTTSTNARSSFSNWGDGIDVYAPGSSIVSCGISSDTASSTLSGTSMASPHVCGVAALIVGDNPSWGVEEVRKELIDTATLNQISDPRGPNRLAFRGCP